MTHEQPTKGSLHAIVLAAAIAATIAVAEAVALTLTSRSIPPRTIVTTVLMAAVMYAGAATLFATAWFVFVQPRRSQPATSPAVLAVAGTIVVELAIVVVSFNDRPIVGHPLVLVALLGGVAGVYVGLLHVITARAWAQRLEMWIGVLAVALTIAHALLTARDLLATPPLASVAATLIVAGCVIASGRLAGRARTMMAGVAVIVAAIMLIAASGTPIHRASGAAPANAPSVLLVTIDTLRADHLGAYGYANAQSPHIDRLAAEGARFVDTVTTMPQTGPAHASILSGLYPWHHGAEQNGVWIHPTVTTIGDVLAARGYATAAVVSGWTVSDASSGLASHFAAYDDNFSLHWWFPTTLGRLRLYNLFFLLAGRRSIFRLPPERPAATTAQAAIDWLDHHRGGPFFLWVHFFDPHGAYAPPAQFAAAHGARSAHNGRAWYHEPPTVREQVLRDPAAVQEMIARYDGEISYTDFEFARVRSTAERVAAGRPLLTVLTADHGESLTEHNNFFDHMDLYDVTLHVPLVVHYPGRIATSTVVPGQTRSIDIVPTIIDLLDFQPLPGRDGVTLVPLLDGQPDTGSRPALGHNPRGPTNGGSLWVARHNGYKLLSNGSWWVDTLRFPPSEELYDLRTDPGETHQLPLDGSVANTLRELLATTLSEHTRKGQPIESDAQERLRALGYNP